jgi:ABC-2 type transport system permease protein
VSARAEAAGLREIRGPSAFAGSWRRTWDLLWLMSVTEFRVQYTNTALGYIWSILKPFGFFGVIYLVISQVLRFADVIPNFAMVLIFGLVLFQYFTESTNAAVRSISAKESMLRKTQFPRIVIPLSVNLSAAITLLFNLIGVFLLLIVAGLEPRASWLLLPIVILPLILLTTTLSMLLAVAFVRSEDVGQAWSLVLRALFYASPILYTLVVIPESIRPLIAANPLTPLIEYARVWVINPGSPTPVDLVGLVGGLLVPAALTIAIAATGLWLFNRDAPRVAEAL